MLAEEIGLHVGDGSMNFYKNNNKIRGFYQLRGHILDDKRHYDTRIREIYNSLFGIEIRLRTMQKTGVYGFQIWNDELVRYKREVLGLPLGKKLQIFIPNQIITNKILAKAFLRGYFDTDGCLFLEKKKNGLYPRIEMSTISPELSQQVCFLLGELGFRYMNYTQKREKYGWKDLHTVRINGIEMAKKWFSEIRPNNHKHVEKFKVGVDPARFELATSRFQATI